MSKTRDKKLKRTAAFSSAMGSLMLMDEMSYPDWRHRLERAERESRAGKGIELETFVKREARRRAPPES